MTLASPKKNAEATPPRIDDIKVGKDILELLSSSMYVDPMSIYREYIQNAADAIDGATDAGLYPGRATGQVDVTIDPVGRSITIRDNGTGISSKNAVQTLLAFGGSAKRGTAARGFRGVGRLAGLGYCQELVFRTKAPNEKRVTELKWDGRRLKEALRGGGFDGTLAELVSSVVSVSSQSVEEAEDHFFEVTLKGIVRHRNDGLLNAEAVGRYLSEVAPVPFDDEFVHAAAITKALKLRVSLGRLSIRINGGESITRPHRQYASLPTGKAVVFKDLETFELPDVDGNVGAILWLVHHDYTGAIPNQAGYKGLRFRSGNVQVGDFGLVDDLFAEPRFNQWTIGEVHVVDPRILAMEKIAARSIIPDEEKPRLQKAVFTARKKLEKLKSGGGKDGADPLARLPAAKRTMYEQFFELVYSCSVNQSAAKLLVERMLNKIS